MQTFKKAIVSTTAFILLFALFSSVVIELFISSDKNYYNDIKARNEYAGTLDTLYCGSSHGLCAFSPEVIDDITGRSSYNLCGSLATLSGIHKMLEIELERNPVDTVVVEICFNTISRDEPAEGGEGELYILTRIEDRLDRMAYLMKNVKFKDYAFIYSTLMLRGLDYITSAILGRDEHEGSINRGQYRVYQTSDLMIPEDQLPERQNSYSYKIIPLDANIKKLDAIVKLCREYNVHIVFVVTPISDALIFENRNFDSIMQWYIDYCNENSIEYYDFNLLKDRRSLISDQTSYRDNLHLNPYSADVFSTRFAEIMLMLEKGEDVRERFYQSYDQYKSEQPYTDYYKSLNKAE